MAFSDDCCEFNSSLGAAAGDPARMRAAVEAFTANLARRSGEIEPWQHAALAAAARAALDGRADLADWNLLADLADAVRRHRDTPPGLPAADAHPAVGWLGALSRIDVANCFARGNPAAACAAAGRTDSALEYLAATTTPLGGRGAAE
jgi:hypothetical protein